MIIWKTACEPRPRHYLQAARGADVRVNGRTYQNHLHRHSARRGRIFSIDFCLTGDFYLAIGARGSAHRFARSLADGAFLARVRRHRRNGIVFCQPGVITAARGNRP